MVFFHGEVKIPLWVPLALRNGIFSSVFMCCSLSEFREKALRMRCRWSQPASPGYILPLPLPCGSVPQSVRFLPLPGVSTLWLAIRYISSLLFLCLQVKYSVSEADGSGMEGFFISTDEKISSSGLWLPLPVPVPAGKAVSSLCRWIMGFPFHRVPPSQEAENQRKCSVRRTASRSCLRTSQWRRVRHLRGTAWKHRFGLRAVPAYILRFPLLFCSVPRSAYSVLSAAAVFSLLLFYL